MFHLLFVYSYLQNFMKRKLLLEEQKRNQPQPSHDHCPSPSSDTNENSSNHGQLLTLPQIERKERNYRPIEFQGTLGKVAPSSISAPRKTIDVPLSGGSGGGVEGAKDTYTKKKQTLAVIEKVHVHEWWTSRYLTLATKYTSMGVEDLSKISLRLEILQSIVRSTWYYYYTQWYVELLEYFWGSYFNVARSVT